MGLFSSIVNFNPRSLTGATENLVQARNLTPFQSTLPHGSDRATWLHKSVIYIFQSTLPHGSDSITILITCAECQFQSTLPHGSDPLQAALFLRHIHFNPRSLTGATYILSYFKDAKIISIHAPSRERLWLSQKGRHKNDNFNPRSLTGATNIQRNF